MRRFKGYVTAFGGELIRRVTAVKGEAIKLEWDWNGYLGSRSSATVSSSAWSTEGSNVALSGAANSGGVTSTLATMSETGDAVIKNTATLSNNEILVRKFRVQVIDPDIERLTDYQD